MVRWLLIENQNLLDRMIATVGYYWMSWASNPYSPQVTGTWTVEPYLCWLQLVWQCHSGIRMLYDGSDGNCHNWTMQGDNGNRPAAGSPSPTTTVSRIEVCSSAAQHWPKKCTNDTAHRLISKLPRDREGNLKPSPLVHTTSLQTRTSQCPVTAAWCSHRQEGCVCGCSAPLRTPSCLKTCGVF
jgi:hypothetical protein